MYLDISTLSTMDQSKDLEHQAL